jgi:alpha-ribazole phosphatase
MRLFLIRHGETEYNEQGKIQGHIDIPLSSEGRKQASVTAELLMEHVEGRCVAAVYSSDLKRSGETAEPFIDMLKSRGYDFPVYYLSQLREVNLGVWQGRTRRELLEDVGEDGISLFARWLEDPTDITPENGESMPFFFERVKDTLYEIIDENKDQDCCVIIFTHSGNLSMILNYINGNKPMNFVKYSIDNASGIVLEYKDGKLEEIDRI